MFKVILVGIKSGVIPLKSFPTREEADEFILTVVEQEGIKTGYLEDTSTGEREKIEGMK